MKIIITCRLADNLLIPCLQKKKGVRAALTANAPVLTGVPYSASATLSGVGVLETEIKHAVGERGLTEPFPVSPQKKYLDRILWVCFQVQRGDIELKLLPMSGA